MNDKQQLAAMGEHMAEHMAGQAEQPMCMAKRIEEAEFQKWCKRMLPYFQAAAEGKTVQTLVNGVWSDKRAAGVRGPHREYRIKPDSAIK